MRTILGLSLIAITLVAQPKLAPASLAPVDQAAFQKVLAAHRGKVTLASFWATWCVPCRKEMPELLDLSQRLAARGFDLVLISADEPAQEAAARKVLGDNGVTGLSYLLKTSDNDKFYPTVDSKWSSGALPALFLYDRAGRKAQSFIGETSIKDLEAAITKLM
jgi:thiol-disulfide isomerase/thioredoxin